MLKDLADSFVGLGRALQVFLGADLLADVFGLVANVSVRWFL